MCLIAEFISVEEHCQAVLLLSDSKDLIPIFASAGKSVGDAGFLTSKKRLIVE
jgi:hypothetical protein